MKSLFATTLLAAAALLPLSALAQPHEGDIELSLVGNRITLAGNDAVHANGLAVFEGDFGDLEGGPYKTDDPGFDNEPGTFAAGTILTYRALGSLQFWNGSAWTAAVLGNEYLRLDGNTGEDTRWNPLGLVGDLTGLIGQAGVNGQIHEHLDFSVARTGGGIPTVGAYLVQLQLESSAHLTSAPYYMAFNRGLSDANFEMAVEALAVPEAQTWLMMLAGLIGVAAFAQRRQPR